MESTLNLDPTSSIHTEDLKSDGTTGSTNPDVDTNLASECNINARTLFLPSAVAADNDNELPEETRKLIRSVSSSSTTKEPASSRNILSVSAPVFYRACILLETLTRSDALDSNTVLNIDFGLTLFFIILPLYMLV